MIFAEIMRWREGDRGHKGAEIISRKVLAQSDSWRLEPLFKVKMKYSEQECELLQAVQQIQIKFENRSHRENGGLKDYNFNTRSPANLYDQVKLHHYLNEAHSADY